MGVRGGLRSTEIRDEDSYSFRSCWGGGGRPSRGRHWSRVEDSVARVKS